MLSKVDDTYVMLETFYIGSLLFAILNLSIESNIAVIYDITAAQVAHVLSFIKRYHFIDYRHVMVKNYFIF